MGETRDLIGIYGAVDREAARNPEAREGVAQLLPVYAGDDEKLGKVHWFDDFVAWTNERRQDESRDAFPTLEEALQDLAVTRDKELRPRLKARLLFAIALAARAFPEMREPGSDLAERAVAALQGTGIAPDREHAQRVLDVLGDRERVREDEPEPLAQWWAELLQTMGDEGLMANPEAIGPRPCTGRLVVCDLPGGPRQVATLRTDFETDQVKFDKATRFLEPTNWPRCSDFWCRMDKVLGLPAGVDRYDEVVSVDCDDPDTTWTLQALLDFKYWRIDGLAVAEYELPGRHPQAGNVLVDEGSLVVRRLGADPASKIAVTTTKRVLFDRVFDGRALALVMCALGYAEVAHDFVFHCAALPDEAQADGTEFPGKEPVAPAKETGTEFTPMIKVIAAEAAASVKACIDDYAEGVQNCSEKIEKGEYTADDAVSDMAKTSARMVREGATAVDVGVRNTGRPRQPRARGPSED